MKWSIRFRKHCKCCKAQSSGQDDFSVVADTDGTAGTIMGLALADAQAILDKDLRPIRVEERRIREKAIGLVAALEEAGVPAGYDDFFRSDSGELASVCCQVEHGPAWGLANKLKNHRGDHEGSMGLLLCKKGCARLFINTREGKPRATSNDIVARILCIHDNTLYDISARKRVSEAIANHLYKQEEAQD